MTLTLEADYAVRMVYFLAAAGRRMGARAVAEETGVPPRFTLKILRELVGAGLIRSFKGKRGGYELARPADTITLRQIIETVEGDLAFCRCLGDGFVCSNRGSRPCAFQRVYDELTEMIVQKLDSVTIGSMLPPLSDGDAAS